MDFGVLSMEKSVSCGREYGAIGGFCNPAMN
jgi:hypothetical protein